jgi:hypothetical protein
LRVAQPLLQSGIADVSGLFEADEKVLLPTRQDVKIL